MAEPIGLTAGLLSLVALFSTCIDCFDFYNATQDCDEELRTSGPHYLDKPGFDPKACPMIG